MQCSLNELFIRRSAAVFLQCFHCVFRTPSIWTSTPRSKLSFWEPSTAKSCRSLELGLPVCSSCFVDIGIASRQLVSKTTTTTTTTTPQQRHNNTTTQPQPQPQQRHNNDSTPHHTTPHHHTTTPPLHNTATPQHHTPHTTVHNRSQPFTTIHNTTIHKNSQNIHNTQHTTHTTQGPSAFCFARARILEICGGPQSGSMTDQIMPFNECVPCWNGPLCRWFAVGSCLFNLGGGEEGHPPRTGGTMQTKEYTLRVDHMEQEILPSIHLMPRIDSGSRGEIHEEVLRRRLASS